MCGRLTEDEQEQERAEPRSAFRQAAQLSVEHQQASAEAASSPSVYAQKCCNQQRLGRD